MASVLALLLLAGPALAAQHLLLEDDFGVPDVWFVADEPGFRIAYQEGGYRIRNSFFHSYVSSVRTFDLTDVEIAVDAQRVAGPDTGYFGAVCRWQDIHNYYALVVGAEGFFGIARVLNGEVTFLTQASEPDMIQPDTEVNRVGGTCWGDVLTLIVNDEALLEVQDGTFGSGFVGMMVGTRGQPDVEVHFDNVAVGQP
jgi:hypothetical protein